MTPFEAFQLYVAIKRHFNSKNYDVVKYNWKVKVNIDTFNKRKDKFFFEKLSRINDLKGFLIANFLVNPKVWVKDIAYTEHSRQIYEQWLKRNQSLMYYFSQNISILNEDFNSNFIVMNNQHPPLLKLFLGDFINLETLIILCDMVGCINHWDKHLSDDPLWQETKNKITKYKPFLHYDKDKVRDICLNNFNI